MNSKKVKIFGITLIMLVLIGISNYSLGADADKFKVFKDNVPTYIKTAEKDSKKHFFPTKYGNNVLFCIQWGGSFRASLTKKEYDDYSAKDYTDWKCQQEFDSTTNPVNPPWSGQKNYLEYEEAGNIDFYSHQDEAYTLATAKERGNLEAWESAYATWSSSVSDPRQAFAESAEGDAYKVFYTDIHSGQTDIFETKLQDLTKKENVKVGVNQPKGETKGSYTVGPFKVNYPNGQHGEKNLFDWINKITIITTEENNGGEKEYTVTIPYEDYEGNKITYENKDNVKLYDKDGKEIDLTKLGKNGSERLSEFYIKFESNTATRVKVKITFGYLEHCKAEMTKYTGKFIYWSWGKETSSTADCPHSCTHEKSRSKYCKTPPPNTCTDLDKCDNYGYNITYEHKNDNDHHKRYKLKKEDGGASQILMAVGETGKYDEKAELELAGPEGIDLTIELGGRVWLDEDTGKINEGNSIYDSGEALQGVEVALFELNKDGKRTNTPASVSVNIPHVHTGSAQEGTGCYTDPVYHIHDGSTTSYGTCYTTPSHIHTGNPLTGGGCYRRSNNSCSLWKYVRKRC